jgi:hypothetical protein
MAKTHKAPKTHMINKSVIPASSHLEEQTTECKRRLWQKNGIGKFCCAQKASIQRIAHPKGTTLGCLPGTPRRIPLCTAPVWAICDGG